MFPTVDPIPLPAPIWLFKLLHIVTLSLHFVAMQMLVGGLALVAALSFLGNRAGTRNLLQLQGAAAIAKRLPVVTTYVINLGVPPLLFTQVLYGQAIYTSSVLIGAYWISVIALLTLAYWLFYKIAEKTESHQPAWVMTLVAFSIVLIIGRIYSTNMTLMLRPEVWQAMYSNSAFGTALPEGDPSLTPRWLLMMSGGIAFGGLWMIWISGTNKSLSSELRLFLEKIGGSVGAVAVAVHLACGIWAYVVQSEAVRVGLGASLLYQVYAGLWLVLTVALLAIALLSSVKPASNILVAWAVPLVTLLSTVGLVSYRDGVRDVTLLQKGFDVWDRVVVTNWSVVAIFLVLFVAGLGVVGWLATVMLQAKSKKNSTGMGVQNEVSATVTEGV
ncbi:MAG: hypothetical protein SFU91_13650 [Chloroherpetonaceae bacterium]|nr:hypothetical protein [Chloroherpetonaceae bacterium]